ASFHHQANRGARRADHHRRRGREAGDMTQSDNDQAPRNDDNQDEAEDKTRHVASGKRSIAEWTTLAISLLILLVFVGLISWLQYTNDGSSPIIAVEPRLGDVRHDETGYYLPVSIRNDGSATIADVQIQATLTTPDGET